MNDYRIDKIYKEMEDTLIASLKRNLGRHSTEEKKVGFQFTQWQAAKLKELKRYQRQNKKIIGGYVEGLDKEVSQMLQYELKQGKLDALKNYKKALALGYKNSKRVSDSFFTTNDKKVNALIKAVNSDFNKANHAALRMINDDYRQVIHKASMYVSNGVFTEKQAVDMAIKEFANKGINCIEYSNGSRHKISNYASMAVRTANTRAYLMGEGEFRKRIGETLIIMSKHGTACELCQPFEGKVLIDDVYSGGSSKDGNYMLLSTAMKQGLYHPNCRHGHGTYYKELGKEESKQIIVNDENPAPKVLEVKKSNNVKDYFKSVNLSGIEKDYAKDIENRLIDLQNNYPIGNSLDITSRANKGTFGYNRAGITSGTSSGKRYVQYIHNINFSKTHMHNKELSIQKHIKEHKRRHSKLIDVENGLTTIDHEYAHAIDDIYLLNSRKDLKEFADKYKNKHFYSSFELPAINSFNNTFYETKERLSNVIWEKMKAKMNITSDFKFNELVGNELGSYAKTDKKEFLAEGFSNMRHLKNENKTTFIKSFEEIFNSEFERVIKNGSNK